MVTQKRRRGRPKKAPEQTKSGHKSLRIRARVQFAIEFWARAEGQSETEFIEAAVEAHADAMAKKRSYSVWRKIWHPDESVRWLRTYLLENYPLPDPHEKARAFVLLHREFFYEEKNGAAVVNERNAAELFPHLGKFALEDDDHWAPGRAMAKALEARGLSAPTWPPKDAR